MGDLPPPPPWAGLAFGVTRAPQPRIPAGGRVVSGDRPPTCSASLQSQRGQACTPERGSFRGVSITAPGTGSPAPGCLGGNVAQPWKRTAAGRQGWAGLPRENPRAPAGPSPSKCTPQVSTTPLPSRPHSGAQELDYSDTQEGRLPAESMASSLRLQEGPAGRTGETLPSPAGRPPCGRCRHSAPEGAGAPGSRGTLTPAWAAHASPTGAPANLPSPSGVMHPVQLPNPAANTSVSRTRPQGPA